MGVKDESDGGTKVVDVSSPKKKELRPEKKRWAEPLEIFGTGKKRSQAKSGRKVSSLGLGTKLSKQKKGKT